jgi:hypothetical protein
LEYIYSSPSISGYDANDLDFDNFSINFYITLSKFSILKDFVKAVTEATNIASLLNYLSIKFIKISSLYLLPIPMFPIVFISSVYIYVDGIF